MRARCPGGKAPPAGLVGSASASPDLWGKSGGNGAGRPLGAGAAGSRVHVVSAGGRGAASTRSGRAEALGTWGPELQRSSAFPFIEQPAREERP